MIYFVLSLISWSAYQVLRTKKALQALQQNTYDKGYRYIKWIVRNIPKVFEPLDLLPLFLIILIFFINNNLAVTIIYILIYSFLYYDLNDKLKREKNKLPLKNTSRIKRIITVTVLIYIGLIIYIYYNYDIQVLNSYLYIFIVLAFLQYFVIWFVARITMPIEKLVYFYYLIKAKRKLKQVNSLKVIGITGSYGKTSTKNILNDILSNKYNVLASPKNFNTPYGLLITINEYIDRFTEIFISEMGARKNGEIKELCDIVKPKYGILTKIGVAHLDSFGSQKNIQETKFELIESLPIDGIAILNINDPLQVNYELKNKCKVIWIGIDNKDADVMATDIKTSASGTSFNVIFKGNNQKYHFETILLGYINAYNVLACIALCKELGMSIRDLQKGVNKIKTIEHRLELKKVGDINIIDDAYNSNPIGSQMALDILNTMPGYKIIVTPGMIELGDKQYEYNREFGINMASVCDEVILVGKEQTKPIYDGLQAKRYNEEHIHIINDVKQAFEIIRKLKDQNTYVLLENDLPDIFNE
ncbi:MAG: UDP-N-acetylmuramoyl-tripeptide--D-alanyl-D-alanine ligase [Ignavibacteriales bacterium]